MGRKRNHIIHLTLWPAVLLLFWSLTGLASGLFEEEEEFLAVDEAFQLSLIGSNGDEIKFFWTIADGYYLYRDRISVASQQESLRLGTIQLPAGKEKYDEFFGDVEIFEKQVEVSVPIIASAGSGEIEVTYQGCAHAGLCYPPIKKILNVALSASASSPPSTPDLNSTITNEQDSILHDLQNANPIYAILLSLGFGLLVAFTACMYPMIPILTSLIMGQGEKITTGRAFSLSLSYTQGIALTFGVLGAIMAVIGEALGIQGSLQTPWILIPSAILFVGLAMSMFGFYEIQVPAALQSKLNEKSNQQQGGSLFGVGLMGVLSALIVGPCGGPVLLAVLAFAAQSESMLSGFMYLWIFGTGMGLPLLVMGSGGGALLPKAGTWMDTVKATGGVIMLALAISFLERLSPTYISPVVIMAMWGCLLIVIAIYMGALRSLPENVGGWTKLWKGVGTVSLIYGAMFLIGIAGGGKDTLMPLSGIMLAGGPAVEESHTAFKRIKSVDDLNRELAVAKAAGKPVMLDFYADWCAYCKTMEKKIFPHPQVKAALENVVTLQADITVQDSVDKALADHLDMPAPPALYFWDADGNELRQFRLVGSVSAEQLAMHVNKIFRLGGSTSGLQMSYQ